MKALVQLILNATAAGKDMLLAANAAAQKVLLSLGNVDNTSDANKPVSTAQQTALDAKLALAGGTMTGDLKFIDATYDIGKTGATRPRDGFFSRNIVAGTSVRTTGFYEPGGATTGWYMFSNGVYGYISGGLVYQFFEAGLTVSGTITANGRITANGGEKGTALLFAALPSASANTDVEYIVSDRTNRPKVKSDGTNWRNLYDGTVLI
jgi:hypothetical protein